MPSVRNNATGAASMAATGAQLGSMIFPGIGTAIGAGLGAIGGWLGAGGRELPKGVMSGQDARKLLGQGLTVDQILAMGPVGTFHPGKSMKQFTKMGLSEQDAYRLLSSGGQGAGAGKLAKMFPQLAAVASQMGSPAQGGGPMGVPAFQAMLPAIMGNQAAFMNPAAQQWLGSMFPAGGFQPPAPAPTFPGGGSAPIPFEGNKPQPGKPGPAPSPFLGLHALAGPFGNGGGPMIPNFSSLMPRSRRSIR